MNPQTLNLKKLAEQARKIFADKEKFRYIENSTRRKMDHEYGFLHALALVKDHIKAACNFYLRYKDKPHLLMQEFPKYEKQVKELMKKDNFADKLDKKIQKLSRKIANLSAHEFENGSWWGDDTELGDLPFEIRKELAKFSDWILQNYNKKYNEWLFKLAFNMLDDNDKNLKEIDTNSDNAKGYEPLKLNLNSLRKFAVSRMELAIKQLEKMGYYDDWDSIDKLVQDKREALNLGRNIATKNLMAVLLRTADEIEDEIKNKIKSAVSGLIAEINEEYEKIRNKHWYELKDYPFQTPEQWHGYCVALSRIKKRIKKWFPGIISNEEI